MADDVLYKHNIAMPSYQVDFTRKLPNDTTINTSTSVISSVTKSDGTTITTSDLIDTLTFSGMVMTIPFKAFGVDGEDYRVLVKGVGQTSAKAESFILEVRLRNSFLGVV